MKENDILERIEIRETVDGRPVDGDTSSRRNTSSSSAATTASSPAVSGTRKMSTKSMRRASRPDPYIWGIYIMLLLISVVELFSASSTEVHGDNVYMPLIRHVIFPWNRPRNSALATENTIHGNQQVRMGLRAILAGTGSAVDTLRREHQRSPARHPGGRRHHPARGNRQTRRGLSARLHLRQDADSRRCQQQGRRDIGRGRAGVCRMPCNQRTDQYASAYGGEHLHDAHRRNPVEEIRNGNAGVRSCSGASDGI